MYAEKIDKKKERKTCVFYKPKTNVKENVLDGKRMEKRAFVWWNLTTSRKIRDEKNPDFKKEHRNYWEN